MKHGTSVEEANTFQCSGSHFLQKKNQELKRKCQEEAEMKMKCFFFEK